jgi:cytochrome b6
MPTTRFEIVIRRIATLIAVAIVTLVLIGATTGILLSFYYEPAAGEAYKSLVSITNDVQYGWLFRKAHEIAGNGVIIVSLIQLVVMFLGRQFTKSWLTAWISGILFTLSAIGLGWTAMILDWDQIGYWRFNIELGTIESIPLVGRQLREILTGGGAVASVTIQHLYTIHSYIISTVALGFAIAHLVGVLWQDKEAHAEILEPNEVGESQLGI